MANPQTKAAASAKAAAAPAKAPASPPPMLVLLLAFGLAPLTLFGVGFALWSIVDFVSKSAPTDTSAFYSHMAFLVVCIVTLAVVGAILGWRYALHLGTVNATNKTASLQRRARYYEDMLRLIADNIPNVLFVSDREGRFWFANREASRIARVDPSEIVGKTLDRVFSARSANLLLDRIRRAHAARVPVIIVDRHDDATGPRYMETYHIPLPDTNDMQKTVLVTQKDITAVIVERERQEQTFRQLIDTLVAVVDRRDPYAAGHSLRVGMVSQGIAQQMQLDEQSVEACHVAGLLMNLGKILVPREILTKTTPLNEEELKMVRKAILNTADILSLISFQVPVIPTLRQILERYDGKGVPEGRKGENILLTARIVVVANSLIALVSPRAHRSGLPIDDAITILRKDIGTVFDGNVVDALDAYLKAHPDVQDALTKPPAEMRGVMMEQEFIDALA